MITESEVPYTDPLKQPAMPSRFSRDNIKERPTDYMPLQSAQDEEPLKAVCQQIIRSIENAIGMRDEIIERQDILREEVRAYNELCANNDRVKEQLQSRRAKAVAAGQDSDDAVLVAKNDELTAEIKSRAKNVEAGKGAIQILQAKVDKQNAVISDLNRELENANAAFLKVRRTALVEQARNEFHGLHRTLAKLLAIENSTYFRYGKQTWYFIEHLSSGVDYRSNFRPDFLNSSTARAFPGYAAECAALDAELRGEEVEK
jgi:hypothetical protein